jgi:hypothetical protein
MPLQTGMGEIDRAFTKRPVEIATLDQHEIHEIAGEFQREALAGVILWWFFIEKGASGQSLES